MKNLSERPLRSLLISIFVALLLPLSGYAQIYYVSGDSLWVKQSNDSDPIFITEGTTYPIQGIAADTAGGVVYWSQGTASNSKIYKASLDSLKRQLVTDVSGSARGVALDVEGGMLYWADIVNDGGIFRVSTDGGDPENLVAGESDGVTDGTLDIDLDLENRKMYWVKYGSVMRADLDGSNVEKVVDIPSSIMAVQPTGIALDASAGYVYWANSSSDQIERASIDGSEIETVANTDTPIGVDVNPENGRVYWVENYIFSNEGGAIFSINPDGTDKKEVIKTSYTRGALYVGSWELATSIEEKRGFELPTGVKLAENYPNPFNPQTIIPYELPKAMNVSLTVYNFLGQKVKVLVDQEVQSAGSHKAVFDAQNLASGTYFYNIRTGESSITRKMMLIK